MCMLVTELRSGLLLGLLAMAVERFQVMSDMMTPGCSGDIILVLPDHIVNWLTGYFAERGHITQFQGIMSAIAFINARVVQGSGIGPSSYIVVASDLQPINRENKIAKYADDSYLPMGCQLGHCKIRVPAYSVVGVKK